MNITISRLKELINEELGAFNEEQEELEEASGDRNDPDREQGHGPQRQRAGSTGGAGEYLEEAEEELEEDFMPSPGGNMQSQIEKSARQRKKKGKEKEKEKKGKPGIRQGIEKLGQTALDVLGLEETGRMMKDKQRGAEDPTRLRLEEYVAAMVDNYMLLEFGAQARDIDYSADEYNPSPTEWEAPPWPYEDDYQPYSENMPVTNLREPWKGHRGGQEFRERWSKEAGLPPGIDPDWVPTTRADMEGIWPASDYGPHGEVAGKDPRNYSTAFLRRKVPLEYAHGKRGAADELVARYESGQALDTGRHERAPGRQGPAYDEDTDPETLLRTYTDWPYTPGEPGSPLQENIASIVDTYMNIVMEQEKKEGLGVKGLGKAETQKKMPKVKFTDKKKKITPLGDTKESIESEEPVLDESEEPGLEVNETLAGWYNKTLFESLSKKWSK